MDTGAECLKSQPAATEETKDASNATMPLSPNTTLPPPTSNLDINPGSGVIASESPVKIPLPSIPTVSSFKRKTPSIERFLDSRRECFWPIGNSTISDDSFTRDSGIKGGLSSALKPTLAYFSHSITEYILAVVHKIRRWSSKIINAVSFGLVTRARLMPQIAKIMFGTEIIAVSAPTDVLKAVPLPLFPIRVFYGKPPPFSLATQKRKMRWRYRWRFSLAPEIIQEPKIQHIQETVRQYIDFIAPETETISVELLAQGAFNQAYNITAENKATGFRKEYIFRVALPIYPHYKVESDVATTEFIRHTTTVPVPIIYAFDSCPNNELGFEWMLMEKVKGIPLDDTWDTMAYSTKKVVAKTVANWVNQISRHKFDRIGSLYCRQRADQMEFYMGPTLQSQLYEGDRLLYDIHRGPFDSIQSYFDAVLESTERHMNDPKHSARHKLEVATHDGASSVSDDDSSDSSEQGEGRSEEDILFQADDKDRRNERWYGVTKGDLDMLPDELRTYRELLPKLCPLFSPPEPMTTMLMHPDLSTPNIFVNESGAPVALIDWERARIEPNALLNPAPLFLTNDPDHDADYFYIPAGFPVSTGRKGDNLYLYADEDLARIRGENEGMYTQVMENIQLTHLRALYREELKRLQSPICKAFEKDAESLEQQLISRVFFPEDIMHNWASDWAAEHLGESVLAELEREDTSEDQEEPAEGGDIQEVNNIVEPVTANPR